jgi:hypothetical protein
MRRFLAPDSRSVDEIKNECVALALAIVEPVSASSANALAVWAVSTLVAARKQNPEHYGDAELIAALHAFEDDLKKPSPKVAIVARAKKAAAMRPKGATLN